MDVSNFTDKSKLIINSANTITTQNRNPEIKDLHMMVAFLEEPGGIVRGLLETMDVDCDSLKAVIQSEIDRIPKLDGALQIKFSPEVEKALDEADKQAKAMKDERIGCEHLMLGLISAATETLKNIFKAYRIDKKNFLSALKNIRENVKVEEDMPADYDVLTRYGKLVTELAKENKLNPVIGRDD